MANYLPVLLVSVTTTSIAPDDSSVSTLPRGQVDYLSHDWQEEDVWRSWRKMTRQKNEIANGKRLENASWRTWWKQRNKLKTVTPETLNWLKDSDVTWLYGPLHTAVDWSPPARLKPDDTTLLRGRTDQPRHKPILKYRSISELLTGELPTSPVFSPTELENGAEQAAEVHNVSDDSVLDGKNTPSRPLNSKRPALVHTKSDTHITRWGPDRAFRKESPPRIDPPGSSSCIATNQSKSSVDAYFSPSQIRSTYSQDSNSSTGTSTTGLRSSHATHKKKHISFNTFVEQCIAIEKPNNEDDTPKLWGERKWDDDDGYEEDKEDNDDDDGEVWIRQTPRHLSGSAIAGSDSESGDDEGKDAEEDEDDVLEIRPRSYSVRGTPRTQRAPRSPSTSASISTPSSRSTSTSSPSRSLSPSSSTRRRHMSTSSTHPIAHTSRGSTRRSSTTSTYRPRPRLYTTSHHPFIRMRARGGGVGGSLHVRNRDAPHVHVTIAPIAPTILKTTDSGYDGWAEGFGDEGGSDDGLWGGKWGASNDEGWKERDTVQTRDGQTTPVELVYVPPPFVGRYSPGSDAEEEDFDLDAKEEVFEEQIEGDTPRPTSSVATPQVVGGAPISESPEPAGNDPSFISTVTPPSPTVLMESLRQPLQGSQAQESAVAVFGNEAALRSLSDGQNIGDNLSRRPSSPEDRRVTSRSRSRTHSRSRTPSPAVSMPPSEMPPNAAPTSLPVCRRSSSVSPPDPSSSSLLCPPVQRGRSVSYQDLPTRGQRGRSSTRTPPSYSSDRERQGESPIGSLSPDSSFVRVASIVGGVYASGRTDKERQKEKERREEQCRERDSGRDRERGRDRSGKRSSQSLSPDIEAGTSMKESFSAEARNDHTSNGKSSTLEATYYATGTAQPAHPQEALPPLRIPSAVQDNGKGRADEETEWTHSFTQPTPSNSPTITMKVALAGPVGPKVDTTFHTPSQSQNASSSMKSHVSNNFSPASPHSHPSHTQSPTIARTPTTGGPVTSSVRSPMKGKSPLLVPPPHPIEPSTSLSISPPGAIHSLPVMPPQQPQRPGSPTEKEPTIVEKAVGIMSSAGALLGLWHP